MAEKETFAKSFNPWLVSDRNSDALKALLRSADASGLIKLSFEEDEGVVLDRLKDSSPSLILIQKLREISQKRNELEKVNLAIQRRLMDKETRDITHLSVLENRITQIKELNSHLNAILENKELLTTRLQQPMVGDHIKVEAQYHKHLTELFQMIAAHLTELSKNLDCLGRSSELQVTEEGLNDILGDISAKLAQIHVGLQKLQQMRAMVHRFQENSSASSLGLIDSWLGT